MPSIGLGPSNGVCGTAPGSKGPAPGAGESGGNGTMPPGPPPPPTPGGSIGRPSGGRGIKGTPPGPGIGLAAPNGETSPGGGGPEGGRGAKAIPPVPPKVGGRPGNCSGIGKPSIGLGIPRGPCAKEGGGPGGGLGGLETSIVNNQISCRRAESDETGRKLCQRCARKRAQLRCVCAENTVWKIVRSDQEEYGAKLATH